MSSEVEICNRALQKLGAKRIVSLTEDSPNARSCNFAYTIIRDEELRKHTWSCATKRASLAALTELPLFGKALAFQLPSDFIRLLPPDASQNLNTHDWQIEGNKIYTDYGAPLEIRYVFRLEDPNVMDSLFKDVVAVKLAMELAEEITQSNTKKNVLAAEYRSIVNDAKRVNAIERPSGIPPEDTWITARQ
jgi:hypothetical protein